MGKSRKCDWNKHVSCTNNLTNDSVNHSRNNAFTLSWVGKSRKCDWNKHVSYNLVEKSQSESRVSATDVVQKLIRIFTDDRLLVVASDVVPGDAVVVNIVEDAEARFCSAIDVEFSVIGLTLFLVASLGPGIVAPAVGDLERE